MSDKTGTVNIHVFGTAQELRIALAGADVQIHDASKARDIVKRSGAAASDRRVPKTGLDGSRSFTLPEGDYVATATFKGLSREVSFDICPGATVDREIEIDLESIVTISSALKDVEPYSEFTGFDLTHKVPFFLKATWHDVPAPLTVDLAAIGATVSTLRPRPTSFSARSKAAKAVADSPFEKRWRLLAIGQKATFLLGANDGTEAPQPSPTRDGIDYDVTPPEVSEVEGDLGVSLKRTATRTTGDLALWAVIRRATNALSFDRYMDFMNWIFCGEDNLIKPTQSQVNRINAVGSRRFLPFSDTDAYRNVKAATEAFLMANCGVVNGFQPDEASYIADYVAIDTNNLDLNGLRDQYLVNTAGLDERERILPYLAVIRAKLADEQIKPHDLGSVDLARLSLQNASVESCYGVLRDRLHAPCLIELIWSYWQEEGMLVQTMNAVTRRFQNMRSPMGNDPLANLEIDPLRSLNNLLWGTIQDEQHRLSVVRRNYEYDHHYGLRLAGKAVDGTRPADSRSKFLEAFHTLLSIVGAFYKRDDDTTMVADGFPVLNALKEAHLILSQGAHNQFGDLPSTARIEMLMQQWILARPEFREFIPTRIMVAYPEPWMDRVDAMKRIQNWTDTSVLHFRNLAIFGEQILLGIRYGNWNSVFEPVQAVNWARYWRPQIQGYMHAYRAVTGVDLSVDVTNANIDAMMPSVHLVRRLAAQQRVS